jgi:hypothetical protein
MAPDGDDWQAPKSGRLLLRMPSTLHEDVARAAAAEGISLNQFICSTLAGAVEWRSRKPPLREVRKVRHEVAWDLWREGRRGRGG